MNTLQLRCLVALADTWDYDLAGHKCGVSASEVMGAIRTLEARIHARLVNPGEPFVGFTREGDRTLAWARLHLAETEELNAELRALRLKSTLAPLLERRSVSPKRLRGPGPNPQELDLILQAALRAPDHGGLHPWRVVQFGETCRAGLADLFEQEKLRRDPLVGTEDRQRAREHALRPPVLLAFVVSPRSREKVPLREQWLAAGAALCNLLNATHQLGFGAIVLSGDRCFDDELCTQLEIAADEFLAGFISLGSIAEAPPARHPVDTSSVLAHWQAPRASAAKNSRAQSTEAFFATAARQYRTPINSDPKETS